LVGISSQKGVCMTLRPEYSLGRSAYNDFLHAPLGHDAAGTELTVLSALTRLGVDPWAEAARLADLSRPAAAQALAAAIARLPGVGLGGTWTESEAAAVAFRLVGTLPKGSRPEIPQTPEAAALRPMAARASDAKAGAPPVASRTARPSATTWLLWGSIAVAFYLLVAQLGSVTDLEPASRAVQSEQ
jgi:hypothetical protein